MHNLRYRDAVWTNIEIMKNKNLIFGCINRSKNNMIENNLKFIEDMRIINSVKSSLIICIPTVDFNYRDIDWETYCTKRKISIQHESKFIESIKICSFFNML